MPSVTHFKPAGIPLKYLQETGISIEEIEALRLKDVEHLEQEDCAGRMNVSRPTFQRVLALARYKVADALLHGKAIKIEGGVFEIEPLHFCCSHGHGWEVYAENLGMETAPVCPVCNDVLSFSKIENRNEEKKPMRYAVPVSQGQLAPHFGHCDEFMLINMDESGRVTAKETIPSPGHQCGYLPVWLAGKGVNVIIAGGMGMTPRMLFQQNNIDVVLGVQESDPEKAAMAHFNNTLACGQNQCEHGDQACSPDEVH